MSPPLPPPTRPLYLPHARSATQPSLPVIFVRDPIEEGIHMQLPFAASWLDYCEFAFEILSAAVTFWFCMDNKLMCDNLSMTIMLADASVVTIEVHTREAEDAHPLMRQTLQNCTVQPIMALPAAPSHSGGEQGIGQQAPYAIELRN